MTRRLAPLVVLAALAGPVHAAPPEIRGTWVTTTGYTASSSTVYTPAATGTNFARLRAIGLNTVYMDAWRNGETYFKSDTLKAFGGGQLATGLGTRDLFAETLVQSHRNGMSQYAWLQYGFATQFLSGSTTGLNALTTKAKNNGWLLQDAAGNYSTSTGNKYAWMNPLVPEVRQFVIGLGVELATKYDVDGIQFDDRLAWPVQFGYDATTRSAYLAETGRALPGDPTDAAFVAWRAAKVTEFAREFSVAVRRANPNVKVAAAPGVYPYVYNNYAVDSPDWTSQTVTVGGVTRPLFDEVTPQVYNSSSTGFRNDLNYQMSVFDAQPGQLVAAGISIDNSSGPDYDWATVNKRQVDQQRATAGTSGQIWWYSDGVLNTDEANLTAYYNVAANGQAARPDRAEDFRPAPTLAAATGATWTATPGALARYSVIGFNGTTWTELLNTVLPNASIGLSLGTGYSKVELLVDRRGFTPGDANFDGKVDPTDLAAWQANRGAAGKMWAQADFTLDGLVNDADLAVLGQYWGTGVIGTLPPLATLVPEPTTLAAMVFGVAIVRRRRDFL